MPSLFDGMPKTEAEMLEVQRISATMIGAYVSAGKLSPKAQSIFDALEEGQSLGDIMNITKQEREALLVQGTRQLQAGDLAGAQETLLIAYRLEPTDARAVYALAAAFQAQQEYAYAAKMYLVFLALDATNPQGYLRLGECLMANREFAEAEGFFEAAKALAAGTRTAAAVNGHADAMLGAMAARAA